MATYSDYKRWMYEYHCWLAGNNGHMGFYDFLRKMKCVDYHMLNLDRVTDDESALDMASVGMVNK